MNIEALEENVLLWLAANHPAVATQQKVQACIKSALMLIRPLPRRDENRAIVPFGNAYLEIMPDGSFVRLVPEQKYGLTFVLQADLPGTDDVYVPAPVPEGSLFGHYLGTSLPDVEIQSFLQELAGDTLFPNVRFQVAALLKGKGRNGKSIYTRLLAALHGKANVARMRLDRLSGFSLGPLVGASLAVVDEVPKHGIDEQTMKTLISGESVTVDIKYRDPVSTEMTAKWVICTNNDQKSSDNSDGFWRRLAVIPFDTQIAESDVIPELDAKIIRDELVVFLDWCLIGLQRLLQRGKLPPPPKAVADAKKQARMASDTVLSWIEEHSVEAGAYKTPKDNLFDHFDRWCGFNNYGRMASNRFWMAIKNHFGDDFHDSQATMNGKRVRVANLHV